MASIPVEQAREDVAVLFLSYLNRAPEFQAMNYYVALYNQLLADQGDNPAAMSNAFKELSAQIYVDGGTNGEVPTGPAVDDTEYVLWIYQNVLGRMPDDAGLAYWVSQLGNGSIARPELVGIMLVSAEQDERDGAYLANRTQVAVEFAKFENSNPNLLPNLAFNAKQVLEGVTDDPATVDAALQKLYDATGGGESFTLTVGVDNLMGTSGDDVFNAVPVNPTNSQAATTLNQFDTVDGGLGRDTLNIYTDGTNNIVQQGTVRNIEVINIYNVESGSVFGGAGVDASKFQGAEQVWQYNQATTVNNLGAATAAGFGNIDEAVLVVNAAAAAATVAFTNVGGDADGAVDLTVAGKSLNQVTIAGELAAAAEGEDAPYVLLTATNSGTTNVGTFTLTSAVDVRVDEISGKGITAIDASGSTGDIWYEMAEGVKSFTGGSGDDVIYFDRDLALTDSVDGGEGTDTVVLSTGGAFVTQDYNALGGLKNIENLAFLGDGVSVDAAQLTAFAALQFIGTGDVEVSNLAADQVIGVMFNPLDDESEGIDSLTLSNAAADVSLMVDGVDFDLAIDEGEGGVGATGGTLMVMGEGGSVDFDNSLAAKFTTIDVSEYDGGLFLTLADDLAETVVLGAGSATIYLDDTSSTVGALDTIENFKPASDEGAVDVLDLFGGLEAFTLSSAATSLNLAWGEAAAAYEGDILVFTFQGDTYLYANTGSATAGSYDNSDFAVKVVGEFTVEDFMAPL